MGTTKWRPRSGATPGEIIREWRKFREISQARLAELVGLKQSAVSDWEADWKLPNVETRRRLEHETSGELPLSMWEGIERAARKPARATP